LLLSGHFFLVNLTLEFLVLVGNLVKLGFEGDKSYLQFFLLGRWNLLNYLLLFFLVFGLSLLEIFASLNLESLKFLLKLRNQALQTAVLFTDVF